MIAVIDYDKETIEPLKDALDKLDVNYIITDSELKICRSDKVIFPSAREVTFAVQQLHMLNLLTVLRIIKRPILGIDSGMQLFAKYFAPSKIPFLGVISGTINKFDEKISRIPDEGWKEVHVKKETVLYNGLGNKTKFYFEHSHFLNVTNETTSIAENGIDFSASIEKDNYFGVQFVPELSGDAGLKVLSNFIELA